MTPETDGETIDGMSDERIQKSIASLKGHCYQPHPVGQEYITKINSGKKRPQGIPSASNKLVQEVVHMILGTIYKLNFSPRPSRVSAQKELPHRMQAYRHQFQRGAVWFIEGAVKTYFDSFDHHIC